MKQIHSKDRKATFTLPAEHQRDNPNKDRITFAFHYPDMTPITQGNAPEKDEIKIYLSLVLATDRLNTSYAKNLEENAIDYFDPMRSDTKYRTGREGIYRKYQLGKPDKPDLVSIYYIFQAADKQQVWVNDTARWMCVFKVHRTVDSYFDVQYTIAKSLGKDFFEIDKIVTELIHQNITIHPSSKE